MTEPERKQEYEVLIYAHNPQKTVAQNAQTSLDIQDACNLGAVVNEFARVIHDIHRYAMCNDAYGDMGVKEPFDYWNKHPVFIMFASKIASLTDCENHDLFSKAYDECVRLSTEK